MLGLQRLRGARWRAPRTRRIALGWTAALVVWAAAVGGGTVALARYKSAPGVAAAAPERWPVESVVAREPGKPTLVMLAHPRCPCTRASLAELSELMTRVGDRMAVAVLFLRPEGADDDWERGELWSAAAAIPGVHVMSDRDGAEARRFAVSTSGDALLYDAAGHLLFHGGITSARGHVGESLGMSRIVRLLEGRDVDRTDSPVFGCSLWDPNPPNAR